MGCFFAANQNLVGSVARALGMNQAEMGGMISALYCGCVTAVLFFGEFAQHMGKRLAAAVTASVVIAGSLILLLARSAAAAFAGFFVFGVGSAGYESCAISLVAESGGSSANRALNLTQAAFGAGGVATPVLLSLLLKNDAYRPVFVLAGLCYAGFMLYWLLHRQGDRPAAAERVRGAAVLRLLRNPRMLLHMLIVMVYIGSETALTYWIGSYFAGQGLGAYGAMALSAYWLSGILGRLIGSLFQSPGKLLAPCFIAAAAGSALLPLLPGAALKVAAVVLVGLAYAPVYAGMAFLTVERFPAASSAAVSMVVFSAGVGGMAFQPVISYFVAAGRPRAMYALIAALALLSAAVMFALNRRGRKDEAGERE